MLALAVKCDTLGWSGEEAPPTVWVHDVTQQRLAKQTVKCRNFGHIDEADPDPPDRPLRLSAAPCRLPAVLAATGNAANTASHVTVDTPVALWVIQAPGGDGTSLSMLMLRKQIKSRLPRQRPLLRRRARTRLPPNRPT